MTSERNLYILATSPPALLISVRIRAQIPAGVCCAASECPPIRGHGGHTHTLPRTLLYIFKNICFIFWCWCRLTRIRTTTQHLLYIAISPTGSIVSPCGGHDRHIHRLRQLSRVIAAFKRMGSASLLYICLLIKL